MGEDRTRASRVRRVLEDAVSIGHILPSAGETLVLQTQMTYGNMAEPTEMQSVCDRVFGQDVEF